MTVTLACGWLQSQKLCAKFSIFVCYRSLAHSLDRNRTHAHKRRYSVARAHTHIRTAIRFTHASFSHSIPRKSRLQWAHRRKCEVKEGDKHKKKKDNHQHHLINWKKKKKTVIDRFSIFPSPATYLIVNVKTFATRSKRMHPGQFHCLRLTIRIYTSNQSKKKKKFLLFLWCEHTTITLMSND